MFRYANALSHGASRGSIICMVEMRKYVVRIIPDDGILEGEEKTQGWRDIYFFFEKVFLGRLLCHISAVFR